ncbi:hypothetical protein EDB84DRAFT_1555529 [Lactarius hengduanensis]|nr:hypothetical protein EDB84DRAFT_1555529 [Lactarius hengduanensis]
MPSLPPRLALVLFLYSAVFFSLAIPLGGDNGLLYRFSPTSSNETDQLLAWAELRPSSSPCLPHSPRAPSTTPLTAVPPYAHAPIAPSSARRRERGDPVAPLSNENVPRSLPAPSTRSYDFVRDLANTYPHQVTVVPLGHSGEGRKGNVVLSKNGNPEGAKPRCGFLITGAQHAREWVASASALYVAHALLADPSEEFSLARLLDHHNFYIVPVPNPDGYVYTWEVDRFWYKNRLQLGPEVSCVGVDMNRNWGYKWKATSDGFVSNSDKSSPANPCSHWYPGNRPFQAPEVNNMENYFSRLPRLKGFLDLRSYGQMLSTPFSYSCKKTPKDAEDQLEAISGAAHAMKKSHGTLFTTGQLCSTLYRAPGNIIDWVYKKMGVKYSFAAHLRDTGTYGFALPEQWIRPVGEETAKMTEYLADFITGKECR